MEDTSENYFLFPYDPDTREEWYTNTQCGQTLLVICYTLSWMPVVWLGIGVTGIVCICVGYLTQFILWPNDLFFRFSFIELVSNIDSSLVRSGMSGVFILISLLMYLLSVYGITLCVWIFGQTRKDTDFPMHLLIKATPLIFFGPELLGLALKTIYPPILCNLSSWRGFMNYSCFATGSMISIMIFIMLAFVFGCLIGICCFLDYIQNNDVRRRHRY